MARKPTYEELEQRVRELEIDAANCKQAEEEIKRHAAQLATLHETSAAVSSRLALEEIFETVVKGLSEGFDYRLIGIHLIEEGMLELKAHAGYSSPPDHNLARVPLEKGVIGRTARTGQPQLVTRVEEDPDFFYGAPGITSEVCVPLKRGDEVLGVLSVESDRVNQSMDASDMQLLTLLSNYIVIAIENARLYDAAQQELAERKQAEEALRESEETARALLTATNDSAFLTDSDGIVIATNNLAAQRLDKSMDEFVGKCAWDFFPPETEKKIRADVDELIRSGEPVYFDEESNGLFFYNSIYPILDTKGKVEKIAFFARDITKIKRAEEDLQRTKKELETIVDSVPALIAFKDTNNRYIRINKTYAEATNLPREAIEGKSAFDITMNRQFAEAYWQDDKEVIASGIPKRNIIEPMLFDETRTGQTDKIPYRDDKGNIIGVIVFCIDVTSRVRAEESLKESEERYRTLVENVPVAVYRNMPGPKGKFLMANPAFLKMFGLESEEELKKITVADLYMNPAKRKAFSDDLLAKGSINEFEVQLKKKAGSPFWGLVDARVVQGESGKGFYFDCTIMDITARKVAEAALRESERFLTDIFESIQDGISVLNTDLTVRRVNGVIKRWCAENLPIEGKKCHVCYHNSNKPCYPCPTIRCFQSGQTEREIVRGLPGSPVEWIELFSYPIKDLDSGKVGGVVEFARDITQEKKLEEQLQQAQKMEALGTLAGGIAHDFNNLLMGIQGRASLVLMDKDSSHLDFEHLKGIEEYVKSAANLTKQLLGLARGGKYQVRQLDLNEIVKKTSGMFGRTKKEIKIHKKYQKDIWTVEADQGQIEQILINLYVNAWQAMPGGGELYLGTENVTLGEDYVKPFSVEPGKYVKISIADTGVGMDEATKQKIFEPFFTTKERGMGTGLGLASVYGITKNHGGFIYVNVKKARGQNLTFICQPLKRES